MSRDADLRLDDIRSACEKILRYTHGLTFEQFIADEKTVDAVMRNLEIIGEAVKNLPEQFRNQYSEMEWRKIAGLRDIAIHEYFGVDHEIVWDIVQTRVAQLLARVERIQAESHSDE